jgi:Leucine-rich repeat (LRR) protein
LKKITIAFLILLNFGFTAVAQQKKPQTLSNEEIDAYKEQVRTLLNFLQGTFNFLGDPESVAKEKEIIINDSYLKIFLNDKVQIEDDLDEKRDVPLHKDVQAYLKDIEFFFKRVRFEFILVDISHFLNDGGEHYFKVTFNRDLKGITVSGDTVESRKVRYMEVNLDIAKNDLRIASIYTTKLNEKEELRIWWNNLNSEWREVFGGNIAINDSIRLADIVHLEDSLIMISRNIKTGISDSLYDYQIDLPEERRTGYYLPVSFDTVLLNTQPVFTKLFGIKKLEKIDVSNRQDIRSLSPLSELSDLKIVNCQNTLISDLSPIRNLNKLETLEISETPIQSLDPLHYSVSLQNLYFNYTLVNDLSPIKGLTNLKEIECAGNRINSLEHLSGMENLVSLDCSGTQVHDLSPIAGLSKLEKLNISMTTAEDISPLSSLKNLKYLNLENSSVVSMEPLRDCQSLEIVRISDTDIGTLKPLENLQNLKKVYCDNTLIKKEEAINFMRGNPGCLVLFESEELKQRWKELEEPWKQIARDNAELSDDPTKEELHGLLRIEELDISGNKEITTLNPVRRLYNLKKLDASSIEVTDFSPVGDAIELEYLNLSNTPMENLDFAGNLVNLRTLLIENTAVGSLEPIENLFNLNFIYADNSKIDEFEVFDFHEKNPEGIVIFKTRELENWWNGLSDEWKEVFSGKFKMDSPPTKEQLHKLFFLDSLRIENNIKIQDLKPVTQLKGLNKFYISGSQVVDLSPLASLKQLTSLSVKQTPVTDLTSISGLIDLEQIDLENTPVEDLKPLEGMQKLKSLNISGTQVSNLKSASGLYNLEKIAFNNTSVRNINHLFDLPNLKEVQCYNTRINPKNIQKLREAKPDCEVIFY